MDKFTYLSSILSRSVHIEDETDARIAKASVAFGQLRSSVWECKGVNLTMKLSVYYAIILTTLLYASETWTVYQRHTKKLSRFHLNCLCKLLKVKWQDKVPNTDSRADRNVQCLHHAPQVTTPLGWTCHQDV